MMLSAAIARASCQSSLMLDASFSPNPNTPYVTPSSYLI
jgi:hypothetical protein